MSEMRSSPTSPSDAGQSRISIEEFSRVHLRVARVVEAERVPGATRLLKLQVDLGEEKRQLVAGIAEAYAPESLIGKSIIVVTNLQPARVRGVESDGMLLAATPSGGKPILATFEDDVAPGTQVR